MNRAPARQGTSFWGLEPIYILNTLKLQCSAASGNEGQFERWKRLLTFGNWLGTKPSSYKFDAFTKMQGKKKILKSSTFQFSVAPTKILLAQ